MAMAMVRRMSALSPASQPLESLKLSKSSYRSSIQINRTNKVFFRAFSVQTSQEVPADHHKSARRLVLYSKPGCCLCDNLKEKLEAVFMIGGEQSLSDVHLEVRDITTKPEWEAAYQYEIPVLARINEDNSETVIPRFSPRISIELIHKKLAAALS